MKSFLSKVGLFLLMLIVGCSEYQEVEQAAFEKDESQQVVSILFDMSGSFRHMMADDGKAYAFCLQVIDRYFKEKIGSNDKIVISIISGSDRSLLWEGRPLDLRKDFPTREAFRTFLVTNGNVGGSLVHDAITQTVEYMLDEDNPDRKSAVFIVSDMLDSAGQHKSLEKATEVLSTYADAGGIIGIFYCDPKLCGFWKEKLKSAGFKSGQFRVESGIVGRPKLPTF